MSTYVYRFAPRLAEVTALIRFDLDLTLGHWRDLRSGAQISAKHLAWSHPAFISSVSARRIATACQAPRRR